MSSGTLRDAYRAFTSTVALITTNGPKGPNVMAAEWTFNVSYDPFLISVHINPENVTHDEILAAGEFGVNLVSEAQVGAMAFAGHYSKGDTDKLSSELFETYPGKRIKSLMLKDALLNAECRLVQHFAIGDHTAFVGEVVEFSVDATKKPVVLHQGSRHLGPRIERTPTIGVAATPMRALPGGTVKVVGELVAPDRARKALHIELIAPDGGGRTVVESNTDEHGYFEATLSLPDTARDGVYTVRARAGDVEGRARVDVA